MVHPSFILICQKFARTINVTPLSDTYYQGQQDAVFLHKVDPLLFFVCTGISPVL